MNNDELREMLLNIKSGSLSVDDGLEKITMLPFEDIGYAKVDTQRELRVGYPEVIYCAGKTQSQVQGIVKAMLKYDNDILGTRASRQVYEAVLKICPTAKYNELGRVITIRNKPMQYTKSTIAIVTAGTSDIPIAEEAAETCDIFANKVERIYDVGVAGIHRLFARLDLIRSAKVVIVIAGMEGALASVVGGLVDKPVIAVPTSVGYGASFNGLSALLSMLNSCASGVSVVNIDNGFGAGYIASMINKLSSDS